MNTTRGDIVKHLKENKVARRRELARLSFHEKILILIRLQEMVNSINKIKGRKQITVWKI